MAGSRALGQAALDVAWRQWTQLGVSGHAPRTADVGAADLEALLLLTFEIGRGDPRLFDEVLDWLVTNETSISVQRLRNLCADAHDRGLVAAVLDCIGRFRPRARLTGRTGLADRDAEPLFYGAPSPQGGSDPAFARHGWLRPTFEPSGKSRRPDLRTPTAFGLRLRRVFGVGVRAEVMRTLLTHRAWAGLPLDLLEADAGFGRTNVRENLRQLQDAGIVRGRHNDFAVDREAWSQVLGLFGAMPEHRPWIQRFGAARAILRWEHRSERAGESDYLRSSRARELIDGLERELWLAGHDARGPVARGSDYLAVFDDIALGLAETLRE